jgi:hypothetical protein
MSCRCRNCDPPSAQQHDACSGICIGTLKSLGQCVLQLVPDRIELVRPIEREDAHLIINIVKD